MLVFYNSLVEKSNCWNTAAFYSCFFFSLLPPWFESGVALGNQFGSRWLLCELNRLGLLAKINPLKVFNFTFCQVLILLIRTGWCQLKSRDVEEIVKLVGPVSSLFHFNLLLCMDRMWHLLSTSWNGWVILVYHMFIPYVFYKHIKSPQLGLRQPEPSLKIC